MSVVSTVMNVGDYMPNFSLPASGGKRISPNELVGHPLILLFFSTAQDGTFPAELMGFRDLHPQLEQLGIVVLGITTDSEDVLRTLVTREGIPFQLISDTTGELSKRFGAWREDSSAGAPAGMTKTFLFTPDLRLAKVYSDGRDPNLPAHILEDVKKLPSSEEPRQIISQAPILLIPNVLPPEFCQTLMSLWETENGDSGFMKQVDGKTVGIFDHNYKIRRDHFIQPGETLTKLQGYLAARVVPEIRKAFNYPVTRREDFRIACYDASKGGYFRPHRDNTTEGTAHRRFAMSLLLNNEYEGGYLRFPEYGRHVYRPEAGGAAIFSCSLLHEATDVTAGRRFVVLSFFYGEAEAKARAEYNKRVGGEYTA